MRTFLLVFPDFSKSSTWVGSGTKWGFFFSKHTLFWVIRNHSTPGGRIWNHFLQFSGLKLFQAWLGSRIFKQKTLISKKWAGAVFSMYRFLILGTYVQTFLTVGKIQATPYPTPCPLTGSGPSTEDSKSQKTANEF